MSVTAAAWRGDAPLLKQLLAAGARLDVRGVSRGEGPYGPLEWAERKVSFITAGVFHSAFLLQAQSARFRSRAHGKYTYISHRSLEKNMKPCLRTVRKPFSPPGENIGGTFCRARGFRRVFVERLFRALFSVVQAFINNSILFASGFLSVAEAFINKAAVVWVSLFRDALFPSLLYVGSDCVGRYGLIAPKQVYLVRWLSGAEQGTGCWCIYVYTPSGGQTATLSEV